MADPRVCGAQGEKSGFAALGSAPRLAKWAGLRAPLSGWARVGALVSTLSVLNLSVILSSLFAYSSICAQVPAPANATAPIIAAASDLAPIYGQTKQYPFENKSISPVFSFGSSAQLVQQAVAGAPFDLLISANAEFLQPLYTAGLADPKQATTLAYGRLAVWSKSGKVRRLEDLLLPSVRHIALANPRTAPYGRAAQQALGRAGLWEKLQSKLVYAATVRQTMQFAQTGNADAVLTSVTLWKELPAMEQAKGFLLPEDAHAPLALTAVALRGSASGSALLGWLLSPAQQQNLASYGLRPARGQTAPKSGAIAQRPGQR